jgi:S-DNA-T family DNA segregation ATPase FtsK/SpoIIIE
LIVVVDEFAELVTRARRGGGDDPLDTLVSLARTGAAFGIHLVLATQRPSGAVTPQIDANVALRVCFRVSTAEEAIDVIADAAPSRIQQRHRGRAFMRAHDEPLLELQSARVAGARPGSSVGRHALELSLVLWHECGRVPAVAKPVEVPDPETDFWDVLRCVRDATAGEDLLAGAVPWPRPLPTFVPIQDLAAENGELPYLLADDPAAQRHRAVGLRLGEGHVGIAGSARAGRTTALRSIAVAAASSHSAGDVHVSLLDFGGGGLRPLLELPHSAGGAFDDWDQASRIIRRLTGEVERRLDVFSRHGYASIADHRARDAEPMPYMLLLIDGWEILAEEGVRFGITEKLAQLLVKGQQVGLQAAIAGDRTVFHGRVGRTMSTRLALRFNDANDYADVGVPVRQVPSAMPDGRVLIVGSGLEAQVGCAADDLGSSQSQVILDLAERWRARDATDQARWPDRVEALPRSITLADVRSLGEPSPSDVLPVLFGLSGETARPLFADLGAIPKTAFVGGLPGSGRTTALRAMASALLALGTGVALSAPGASALGEFEKANGVKTGSPVALEQYLTDGRTCVLLVDDADRLTSDDHEALLRLISSGGPAVVAAVNADLLTGASPPWCAALKRGRTGLLLSPKSRYDGAVFGASSLPESMIFDGPPGRAVAGIGGRLDVVQVPLA